ncbi:hypothetical protein VNO77_42480 [Canavalia gladiata]|uniref:Uncharacterized protein n=1 Tax=Canavalia gladiata TaxID=3824 RepID=A0AAN9JVB1_CANGL
MVTAHCVWDELLREPKWDLQFCMQRINKVKHQPKSVASIDSFARECGRKSAVVFNFFPLDDFGGLDNSIWKLELNLKTPGKPYVLFEQENGRKAFCID